MHRANSKALIMVRPSSNKDRAESQVTFHLPHVSGQSSRIHRNKPLFSPPVNCSVVQFRGYGHADRIQCIGTTNEN